MKQYSSYFLIGILIFHIVLTILSFYSLFSDYSGWTLYQYTPFCYLVYTILWAGVYFKKRMMALAYLLISMAELAVRFFQGKTIYGQVFGDILFPANLIFIAIIVLMYNLIFNSPINETK